MPKLSDPDARAAEEAAEASAPEPIPDGVYIARLRDVTVSDKPGPSGYHFWEWEFTVEDDGYKGRKLTLRTSLSPEARFSIGGAFAAFGVPADTHTDELLGEVVQLVVEQGTINKGPRKGELTNNVLRAIPLDGDGATPFDPPAKGNGAKAKVGNPAHDEDF